jgi:hypothetical protein
MNDNIVKLCDNHVNNLIDGNPCASCPVRKNPNKYKRVYIGNELIKISLSVIGITSLFIILLLKLVENDKSNINTTTCEKCKYINN